MKKIYITLVAVSIGLIGFAGFVVPGHILADSIEGEELVSDPCGTPLPEGYHCQRAAIVSPDNDQVYDLSRTVSLNFRIIGERDQFIYLYTLKDDGTLVTTEPYTGLAGTDGILEVNANIATYADGDYKSVAYFMSSLPEPEFERTFIQRTGNPEVRFKIETHEIPPSVECEENFGSFNVIMDNPDADAGGAIVKSDRSSVQRTFYWLHEEYESGFEQDFSELQDFILNKAGHEIKKVLCSEAISRGVSTTNTSALINLIQPALEKVGLAGYYTGQSATRDLAAQYVTNIINEDGGCLPDDNVANLDYEFIPQSNGRDVQGWVFYPPREGTSHFQNMKCDIDGVIYVITHVTGLSPLIFISSDQEIDANISVSPRAGQITFSRPRVSENGWNAHISPLATNAPLYYEFTSEEMAVPEPEGWIVEGSNLESFVFDTLNNWGYPEAEVKAFIAKDITPAMPESPYVRVQLYSRKSIDGMLPINVSPAPDQMQRVLFHLTPVAESTAFKATPNSRNYIYEPEGGFVLREYGAIIDKG